MDKNVEEAVQKGSAGEVLKVFSKLGVTSFGGPIAHLGYFHDELVTRRKWLSEARYADLVALCQFLPGPASSQVGFALGLLRAGPLGALAAFVGFTLPSVLLLIAFAYSASAFDGPIGIGLIHGLKLVAVAVVAQAVWGMAQNLCPDKPRAAIAIGALAVVSIATAATGQILAILLGAVLGLIFCRQDGDAGQKHMVFPVTVPFAVLCLVLFALLLFGLPLIAKGFGLSVFDSFFRSGALVFGGGHVVLPLLEAEVVGSGWVNEATFLAGYGAAQAVPGPLFTFASFLGASMAPGVEGLFYALIASAGIFLPGFLLLIGALPFWNTLGSRVEARAIMRGANAAVVGILGAALYSPVFTSAVLDKLDLAVALAGFVLLVKWKMPPWVIVLLLGASGIVLQFI
ncbi:chromate efflux transporter [Rhodobacteraceae bacterium RKSG542]|uniref:chromate efflux transporter n=1 Tax=Pseudovibrio flavus TaxID=2529854 RepID=UPI0012BD7E33|nr:chromate efflux transporter [Pseudovibrio flavus]MTI19313.1 chromate efflux transporter [Pseudovibrio flavus]